MPANVTSVLQPMDMGFIGSFKKHYLKQSFSQLRKSLENDITEETFWKNYDIKKAIDNISIAWKSVTTSNLKNVWNSLLTGRKINLCENDEIDTTISEIVTMGYSIGFTDLDSVNVMHCLNEEPQLDLDTLLEIENSHLDSDSEDSDNEIENIEAKELCKNDLKEMFEMIEKIDNILSKDSNLERRLRTKLALKYNFHATKNCTHQN